MKIALLTGASEPIYSTNSGIQYGLKKLGHEVWTVGPAYSYGGAPINKLADVELPDRPHPEYYTYKEVLNACPWTPDFFLCIEPHGYFRGKHTIPSAFYATDQHRAGSLYVKILKEGQYNIQFIGQPNYCNLFYEMAEESHIVLPGFDERRFVGEPHLPEVDIAFVGQTGIADMFYPFEDEFGKYNTHAPIDLPMNPMDRYEFSKSYGFDYAERAEFLIRLSRDFSVRMYTDVWEGSSIYGALQTGRIGFNRSLLYDVDIRCFEVMATGRPLVTDRNCPYLESCMSSRFGYYLYDSHYKPFFGNFDVEYGNVVKLIEGILKKREIYPVDGYSHERSHAFENHTWTKRAEKMIEYMEKYAQRV